MVIFGPAILVVVETADFLLRLDGTFLALGFAWVERPALALAGLFVAGSAFDGFKIFVAASPFAFLSLEKSLS